MFSTTRFRTGALFLLDLTLLAAIILIASIAYSSLEDGAGRMDYLPLILLVLLVVGVSYALDLYDLRRLSSPMFLCGRLGVLWLTTGVILPALVVILPVLASRRGWLAVLLPVLLCTVSIIRLAARRLIGNKRFAERVLVLGTGDRAVGVARETLDKAESGFRVIGFAGEDRALVGHSILNPSVLGMTCDLRQLVRNHRVDRLVIALDEKRGRLPLEALLAIKALDRVAVEESETYFERISGRISLQTLRPSNLIFSADPWWRGTYQRLRMVLDGVAAGAALVLLLPVMLLTVLAIKLDSRGAVFYCQERIGLLNRRFRMLKFRSMVQDAECNGAVWADEADPRITRVGRLIRKVRIDELPQLFNVLKGEMSLIGPRPERPEFLEQLEREIPYYSQRHLVRPGITGWAQVCYPYGASVEDTREKFGYDMYYIKRQSPLLDFIILVETVKIVLFGRLAR